MAQLKDDTILDLYDLKNTNKGLVKKEYAKALLISHQYRIKEIYWKRNAQSTTVNEKRRIFDDITKLNAKLSYLNSSGKNQSTRDIFAERFKEIMNDEQFAQLYKACHRQDDHKIKILMERLHLLYDADNIWKYFQTFEIEKRKCVKWEDKNRMIRTCRRIYENRARLANKLKIIMKKVRNKFRGCKLKKDISYKGQEGIVHISEEQWEEEVNKLACRALDSHDS
jgi:hypothetical protein